jgi:hypothetical protein
MYSATGVYVTAIILSIIGLIYFIVTIFTKVIWISFRLFFQYWLRHIIDFQNLFNIYFNNWTIKKLKQNVEEGYRELHNLGKKEDQDNNNEFEDNL